MPNSSPIDFKLFDSLLEPVFILRADSSVVYANLAAATLCDLSQRKIQRAESFEKVVNFIEEFNLIKNLQMCTDASPYKELHFESVVGKKGKAQVTVQPLTGEWIHLPEGSSLWIMYFRDVTLEETLQKKYRAELDEKLGYIQELEKTQAQLEEYNENLEHHVRERTSELNKLNSMMTALLDSLSQGFFLFNAEGTCLPIASKACYETLEKSPVGLPIWQVIGLKEDKIEGFKKWLLTVFSEMLPFEDLAPLGPTRYEHSKGLHINLDYHPLRSSTGSIDAIVVVATDSTHLDLARQEAEREKSFAQMIIHLIKKKKEISQFIAEAKKLLNDLQDSLKPKKHKADIELIFRLLHTLKGGAASFSIFSMAKLCHEAEDVLAASKNKEISPDHLLSLQEKAEQIKKSFNEFLKSNEQILGTAAVQGIRTIEVPVDFVNSIFNRLNKISQATHIAAELERDLLCVPIGSFFEVYNEVIDQISHLTGKKVSPIKMKGAEIPVRSEIYGDLFTTFVHQFRNAVDHGIETPENRLKAGKPEDGAIEVNFSLVHTVNRDYLKIEISDDGGGIDPVLIRERLKRNGIDTSKETDDEVIQHIFDSQFSTKDTVTSTSGRGVGTDAIYYSAKKLGGRAWVESTPKVGTKLIVEVPYITQSSLGNNEYSKVS